MKADDDDMTAPDELLTISVFARLVGLTPSALRFYDDCGLLRPAFVDPGSAYRYYTHDQRVRGQRLRDLRAVGLPLVDVRTVLDGPATEAARVLNAHVRRLENKVEPARRLAAEVVAAQPRSSRWCRVTLSGPELASAARQVTPAAAAPSTPDVDDLALGCVSIEFDTDEVIFVATDRYRLSRRALRPREFLGEPDRLLVPAAALAELAQWAAFTDVVEIDVTADAAVMTGGGETRTMPTVEATYPDYRIALASVGEPLSRAIVDRARLLEYMVGATDPVVALTTGEGRLSLTSPTSTAVTRLDAICTGEPITIGFGPGVLAPALAASVGPDVMVEFVAPDRPVIVRSADQGTFTTIVMPVLLNPDKRG